MGPGLIAMLLILAAGPSLAEQAAVGVTPAAGLLTAPPKRIFTPPPLQWDTAMLSFRPALWQTATDFANLTGGLTFGMTPSEVNGQLPEPYPDLSWNGLPMANEYPGEVRYFGVPIGQAGALRMDLTACAGASSYVVFLFNSRGLFRLSYRLTADAPATGAAKAGGCADTAEAARELFVRYVPIGQTVALSVRYRTGRTEVVDVTDPTSGDLIPMRWRQGID